MKTIISAILFFMFFSWPCRSNVPFYEENISLSTDRDIYISGENIWFNISCSAKTGIPDSVISRIIYLELYDQKFNSIVRLKFMIDKGFVSGHMAIPSDINSGNYILRAYTQYSRNFHPYSNSSLLICIVNPQKALPGDESVKDDEMLIVPSGGKLIAGLHSKIAVRLTPALCKKNPVIILTDESGDSIQQVIPWKNGLAMVEFTPEAKRKYSIVLHADGNEIHQSLPGVQAEGIMMECGKSGSNIKAGILSTATQSKRYDIEVRSLFGQALYQNRIQPGNTLFIPSVSQREGIVFVVLKQNDSIIRVQPVFIRQDNYRMLTIETNGKKVSPRDSISVFIDNPTGISKEFISVAAKDAILKEDDFLPWYVPYNPALFMNYISGLSVIGDCMEKQIQATMILYEELFNKSEFADRLLHYSNVQWLPEIRDAGISGKVVDRSSRKPVENIDVYASVVNENNQVHVCKTNKEGNFYFTLNHISGIHDIYVTTKPVDSLKIEILINSDFETAYPESAGIIPFIADTTFIERLNRIYRNSRITSIFPDFRPGEEKHLKYLPIPKPDYLHEVTLSDFIEMPVMSEVFTEIVPFVTVKKKEGHYFFQVFDEVLGATYNEPLILIDGIPVFDSDQIMNIDPLLIRKIEVINKTTFLGNFSKDGIINIITHKKDFGGIKLPDAYTFIEFEGISYQSAPLNNEMKMDINDRYPDFRTMLYWGEIPQGPNSISFKASDHTGAYEIRIFATDGSLEFRGKTVIEVQ